MEALDRCPINVRLEVFAELKFAKNKVQLGDFKHCNILLISRTGFISSYCIATLIYITSYPNGGKQVIISNEEKSCPV